MRDFDGRGRQRVHCGGILRSCGASGGASGGVRCAIVAGTTALLQVIGIGKRTGPRITPIHLITVLTVW